LHAHRRIRAINAAVILRRITHGVVSVHERVRHRTIIRHGEMVNTLAQPILIRLSLRRAPNVPLESDFAAIDLIVDPLAGLLLAVEEQVVEERRDSILRDGGVGEGVDLKLRGAAVQADVAVAAGEGAGGRGTVELDREGEVEFAVGVVFVVVWWVAEIAGCGRGED
jgi:hypothetical protein